MKVFLRKSINKGARIKQYFLRGHNSWFSLVFSLINFTIIVYKLLIEGLDFIPNEFKSYTLFAILFCLIYFPLATIFGFYDYKKGTYREEQQMSAELSPVWQELFKRLSKLEEGNEQIHTLLEKSD